MGPSQINIAVFENEIVEVEGAFDYLNRKKYYDGKLKFQYFVSSQKFEDLEKLIDYDLIMIDIDLSSNSELDGFSLIKKIENLISKPLNIVIITGHDITKGYEKLHNIRAYPFIEKPLNFKKLNEKIKGLVKTK